jgi:hypothetical protein
MKYICDISNGEQPEGDITLVDPIVVEDFAKLEETLNFINTNKITTRQVDDAELQYRVGDLMLEEGKACPDFEHRWF